MQGKDVSVEEVLEEVKKDMPFYKNSGGGVTLSGGEPTMQPEFCMAVLRESKKAGMHTTLDTSGYAKWEVLSKIMEYVDLVLYDIKHMDPQKHREYTGLSNELILSNLRKLDKLGIPIEIRMPMIPGLNDSDENLSATARFLSELENIQRIKLLPYHRLGEGKYERLDMEYKLKHVEPPDKERMMQLTEFMQSRIPCGISIISG